MAYLKALRPHISADGVFRAVGEVYRDDDVTNVKVRVDGTICEEVDAPSDKPAKVKKEPKAEEPLGETLIED
jgi:hypothetical protein